MFAGRINIVEPPRFQRQDRGVTSRTLAECPEIPPLQRPRGVLRRRADHIAQRHAEADEFRQGRQKVERRALDTQSVHIARNAIGHEPVGQHGPRRLERERAHARSRHAD